MYLFLGSGDPHRSEEDDFGFGGSYQPSAVSGGSRPVSGGSRRSVRWKHYFLNTNTLFCFFLR